MKIEAIKQAIQELRGRLDRGEITKEQFLELREPLKEALAKAMFT